MESLSTSAVLFFFNDTATTEIYTLSLHDALPILRGARRGLGREHSAGAPRPGRRRDRRPGAGQSRVLQPRRKRRSEEHTSELQSRQYLVCRLLLEKKKTHRMTACLGQASVRLHAP